MQRRDPIGIALLVFLWITATFFIGMGIRAMVVNAHGHEGHDAVSQFYSNWMQMPTREYSCCNLKDCYATQFKREAGQWYAMRREDGAWIAVSDRILEHNAVDPKDSPDGQGHVCMSPPRIDYDEDGNPPDKSSNVYCAVLGTGV